MEGIPSMDISKLVTIIYFIHIFNNNNYYLQNDILTQIIDYNFKISAKKITIACALKLLYAA